MLRLAELVAALSLATDLGLGQPMEHVLRSALIAVRLGDRLGLDESARAAVYYVALLAWLGCSSEFASPTPGRRADERDPRLSPGPRQRP